MSQQVRKWQWLRALAHWVLGDPIAQLKKEPWWDIVEKEVRYMQGMAWPSGKKRKVMKENLLLAYSRLDTWPPAERDVNLAIELLIRGW